MIVRMTKCIVVDDDEAILGVFSDLLEVLNLEILGTGTNGQDAITLYKKFEPDIVFTDLNMPEYDGLYAIELIKEFHPHAKIIAVTADSSARFLPLLNILHIPIINKPFDVHSIKQTINDVLLVGDSTQEPFKISYVFEDNIVHSCYVNFEQYCNLKKLPIIQKIKIEEVVPDAVPDERMNEALTSAKNNDVSKLRQLLHDGI